MTAQFSLFPDMVEIDQQPEPEPTPEIKYIPYNHKKRVIGDNFIVVKCLRCAQMIMVDPETYENDSYMDKVCESCHDWSKYAQYLKLKL